MTGGPSKLGVCPTRTKSAPGAEGTQNAKWQGVRVVESLEPYTTANSQPPRQRLQARGLEMRLCQPERASSSTKVCRDCTVGPFNTDTPSMAAAPPSGHFLLVKSGLSDDERPGCSWPMSGRTLHWPVHLGWGQCEGGGVIFQEGTMCL